METSTSVIHDKSDFRLRNLITAYGVYIALMLLLIVAAVVTPNLFEKETLAMMFRQ